MNKLREVPPVGWIALAAVAGVAFLSWHHFASSTDIDDTSWTDPQQPPLNVPIPTGAARRPGEHAPAFRSRNYPPSLLASPTSIVGSF